jgi:hypothetical protein
MRLPDRRSILIGVAVAALALAAFACSDSNNITSPPMGNATVNVSGDWAGTYSSDTPSLCTGSTASAQLTQQGYQVTGAFRAPGCGIYGAFKGTIDGNNMLHGSVNMAGCTGGAVTGTATASGLQFQVGEFHKDLSQGSPSGPLDVKAGGNVTLTR